MAHRLHQSSIRFSILIEFFPVLVTNIQKSKHTLKKKVFPDTKVGQHSFFEKITVQEGSWNWGRGRKKKKKKWQERRHKRN